MIYSELAKDLAIEKPNGRDEGLPISSSSAPASVGATVPRFAGCPLGWFGGRAASWGRHPSTARAERWGAGGRMRHEDRPRDLVILSRSDAQSAAHVRPIRIGQPNEANRARIG